MMLALAGLTLAAFWPVRQCDFVRYDDDVHITGNPHVANGLTPEGIRWAFSAGLTADSPQAPHWQPLTFLSHMLDVQLYGLNPAGHHMTNLLLHAANVLLLFFILHWMTGSFWRSGFVAALFAIHPLHVESVAWVSERKDVLSGLFWMLTLAAYVFYTKRPRRERFLAVLLLFVLGLMAKPMLVTLPLALLLLDYWPLRRFDSAPKKQLVLEKVPLLILSAGSSWLTFVAQRTVGAVASLEQLSLWTRLANVPLSYLRYIGRMFWPAHLAVFYPYTQDGHPFRHMAGAVAVVGFSVLAFRIRRQSPSRAVGWFWYLVTLVPVIGLVQIGHQLIADRYTYIPLIGLFILFTWGTADILPRWRHRKIALASCAMVLLTVLAWDTHRETGYWTNSVTLFEHSLETTEQNYFVHSQLCVVLTENGELERAGPHCLEAVRIKPNWAGAQNSLGGFLQREGRLDEAIAHYSQALRLKPNDMKAYNNLGYALIQKGNSQEALGPLSEALRLDPDFPEAHNNLGIALGMQGNYAQAAEHYRRAIQLRPRFTNAYNNLGVALAYQQEFEEAVRSLSRAVELDPQDAGARRNLDVVRGLKTAPAHAPALQDRTDASLDRKFENP